MSKDNQNKNKSNKKKLFALPSHQLFFIKKTSLEKGISETEVVKRMIDKEMEGATK